MTSPKPLFWLQAASDEQLAAFCEHNAALTTLLHEAWQKFQTDRADLFSKQPAFSAEPYAPNVSPDELTHSAISRRCGNSRPRLGRVVITLCKHNPKFALCFCLQFVRAGELNRPAAAIRRDSNRVRTNILVAFASLVRHR